MGPFELALAIVGAIFLAIILGLIALFLIFFRKIKAGFIAARTLYTSMQAFKSRGAQRVPAVKKGA